MSVLMRWCAVLLLAPTEPMCVNMIITSLYLSTFNIFHHGMESSLCGKGYDCVCVCVCVCGKRWWERVRKHTYVCQVNKSILLHLITLPHMHTCLNTSPIHFPCGVPFGLARDHSSFPLCPQRTACVRRASGAAQMAAALPSPSGVTGLMSVETAPTRCTAMVRPCPIPQCTALHCAAPPRHHLHA